MSDTSKNEDFTEVRDLFADSPEEEPETDGAGSEEENASEDSYSFADEVASVSQSVAAEDHLANTEPKWYCAHTYSGYENKVKTNIEKMIANRHLEDQILEVRVPLQEVRELKNGVFRQVQKKIFPGYVLVHMILNDDTWRIVRNTRGVTGFVGPDSKAVPLTEEELMPLTGGKEEIELDFEVGDLVVVTCDPWKDEKGVVSAIDMEREVVVLTMEMFRSGPSEVEVGFTDIRKKM